jgi:hypothetical protein
MQFQAAYSIQWRVLVTCTASSVRGSAHLKHDVRRAKFTALQAEHIQSTVRATGRCSRLHMEMLKCYLSVLFSDIVFETIKRVC